ncbi:MAG: hypothetical protein SGILL_007756 [Bacillariaceae sp.]
MKYIYLASSALALRQAGAFVTSSPKSALSIQPAPVPFTHLSAHNIENEHDDDRLPTFDPLNLASAKDLSSASKRQSTKYSHLSTLWVGSAALALATTPTVASAAAGDAVPSAFAAYIHYLSLLLITASVMTERLTVKPNMSIEEEKMLGYADIMTGVAGTALAASGYFRATQYGKGWEFYSHEPIFWLKMTFLGIFGGLSLFPTITIIQRTVKIQQEGTIEPMSEELAERMKKVMNAELTALATIPLTATLMARGVGYINEFPTQIVGPVLFGIVTAGAVYKYVKDAISWKEPGLPVADE